MRLHFSFRPRASTLTPATSGALFLLGAMLAACSHPQLPQWFDSIHRLPLRSVQVEGHRLAYLDAGQGPPLILIHGFGGSMWQWEYQSSELARDFRVITLDLLGSGFSDKPDIEYRPEEVLRFFRGFMDALALDRATLVGNSMGAGVALGMALTVPERVDRLILIGGLPARVKEKLASPVVRQAMESSAPIWLVRLAGWVAGSSVTDRVLREIVHDHSLLTDAVLARSGRNRRAGNYLGPALAVARTAPLWESDYAPYLATIRHPTLVLWGDHDKVFPLAVGQELAGVIPAAQFVAIQDAGHIPQWERPEPVNHAIRGFLIKSP